MKCLIFSVLAAAVLWGCTNPLGSESSSGSHFHPGMQPVPGCCFGSLVSNLCIGYLRLSSSTPWSVPADFSALNSFEAIGPGGSGADGAGAGAGGGGGGGGQGGGYGKTLNVGPSSYGTAGLSTMNFQVGAGASSNATYVLSASGAVVVQGDYGASGNSLNGGSRAQTNVGSTLTYSGGVGGTSAFAHSNGSGGGGAGGPLGNGAAGGSATSGGGGGGGGGSGGGAAGLGGMGANGFNGGANDNGSAVGGVGSTSLASSGGNGSSALAHSASGAGGGFYNLSGSAGGIGGSGLEWTDLGSGGGGGGGGGTTIVALAGAGGNAGSYGGGGGGGGGNDLLGGTANLGGTGAEGIIRITYTPSSTSICPSTWNAE